MKTSKYARDRWTVVRNKLISGDGNGRATTGVKRKDCEDVPLEKWSLTDCFVAATTTATPTSKKSKTAGGKQTSASSSAGTADNENLATEVKEEDGAGSDDDIL